MAGRAVHFVLYVNPVREDHVARKFIHPLPGNLLFRLNILDDFQYLGPFTHGIRCVTSPADFNIWNPGNALPFHITVAKRTAQIGRLFVVDMVEQDGLIHRHPCEGWKKGEEDPFRLNLKPVKGDDTQQKNQADSGKDDGPFLHNFICYLMRSKSVKKKSCEDRKS